jgi:hypothetical protein
MLPEVRPVERSLGAGASILAIAIPYGLTLLSLGRAFRSADCRPTESIPKRYAVYLANPDARAALTHLESER